MNTDMTRDEFLNKYGDVLVTFTDYYKYAFRFSADLDDGSRLVVEVGGDADEIYRMTVDTKPHTARVLEPYAGSVYKDGEIVESFYDY